MVTNYDSARYAMALVLLACKDLPHVPVEIFLPANAAVDVCSAVHLTNMLQCAGVDARVFDCHPGPDLAGLVREVLDDGRICLCLAGLHSEPRLQRWHVAYGRCGSLIEMFGGGFDDALVSGETAHFAPQVIVIFGTVDRRIYGD